jgi:ABC-2 type transport system ATP-binding protein
VTAGPAVVVDGLVKRYAGRAVVDGISFEVAPGEVVALLGPNGAGKTTAVETVEGYRTPDGGAVRVLGTDPRSGGRALRARVGLMLQGDGGVDPRARPLEMLRLFGRLHRGARPADELLALVGLEAVAHTPFRRLSGGERQRLGLALALVGRPEVLVLDEPTAGMDPEARAIARGIVADARTDGAAILLTTHDLGDVERLVDRVLIIDTGRVVASGTPGELAAGARAAIRLRLDRPFDEEALRALAERLRGIEPGVVVTGTGEVATYRIDGVGQHPAVTAAVIAGIATHAADAGRLIVELRTGGGSLEDVYLALVADGRGADS